MNILPSSKLTSIANSWLKEQKCGWEVVAHTSDSSTQGTEAGRPLSLRLAWSIEQVLVQPGSYREERLRGERERGEVAKHFTHYEVILQTNGEKNNKSHFFLLLSILFPTLGTEVSSKYMFKFYLAIFSTL